MVSLESLDKRLRDLEERVEKIGRGYEKIDKGKKEWRIFGREKGRVVFKNNDGELAKIPEGLLPLIIDLKPFDGRIEDDGDCVVYLRGGEEVCRAPKSLVEKLIERGG
jgi:hypothetical protein